MRSWIRLVLLMLLVAVAGGCVSQLPGGPGLPKGDGSGGPGPGPDPGPSVGILEVAVSDPQDDGWRNDSAGKIGVTLYSLNGLWFGGSPGSYEASAFFRWRNVQIPQGATILEASVRVKHVPTTSPGLNEWPTRVDVRGFAYDNMPAFTITQDPDTWPRTDAFQPWDIEEVWSPTQAEWHETPDLKDVIQEIVHRPNWRSGNAIGIAFDYRDFERPPGAREYNRLIYTYEADPEAAPILYVKYVR